MGDEVIDFDFEGEEGEVKEEVLTKECFPMCIVWTWLPPISFLLPFVGHVGVTDSRGLIHDFIGPFTIHQSYEGLGFGPVIKYVPISADELSFENLSQNQTEVWDNMVANSSTEFRRRTHNIITNNCHDHASYVLNHLKYKGRTNWNTFWIMWLIVFEGRFSSFLRFLFLYIPFLVIVTLIFVLVMFA
mmetsp:Transcript_37636/g.52109  ORF Transcript_37636/g.52109 Transcript_37636/m.52109 type:complete len:188 (-) Transcript_37636:202-765(-)